MTWNIKSVRCWELHLDRLELPCSGRIEILFTAQLVFVNNVSSHRTWVLLFFIQLEIELQTQFSSRSCIRLPTNRRVVQPVTWRDRSITAVIQLLFELSGIIRYFGPISSSKWRKILLFTRYWAPLRKSICNFSVILFGVKYAWYRI